MKRQWNRWIICLMMMVAAMVSLAACGVVPEGTPPEDASSGSAESEPSDESESPGEAEEEAPQGEAPAPIPDPAPETTEEMRADTSVYLPEAPGHWMRRVNVPAESEAPTAENLLQAWIRACPHVAEGQATIITDQPERIDVSFDASIENLDLPYEGLLVQSLVNTLTQTGVDYVRLLIVGDSAYSLAGRSYIGEDLTYDASLLATASFRPLVPADPRRDERFDEGVVESLEENVLLYTASESGQILQLRVSPDVVVHDDRSAETFTEREVSDIVPQSTVGLVINADNEIRGIFLFEASDFQS